MEDNYKKKHKDLKKKYRKLQDWLASKGINLPAELRDEVDEDENNVVIKDMNGNIRRMPIPKKRIWDQLS